MWKKAHFTAPTLAAKSVATVRDEFPWRENFLFHTSLSTAQEIMGLRWAAVFAFITHSTSRRIVSLWNHCTAQFLSQLSVISALCQLISDLYPTSIPISPAGSICSWWINHLYPFHISAAPVERGDCLRFSIPVWEEGCAVHTAVSTCRLLPNENFSLVLFPLLLFDQKGWVS